MGKGMNKNNEMNLYDFSYGKNEDELGELFLNMDKTMKYIHSHGYCIKSFNPYEIKILNGSNKQIKFDTLLEMPQNTDKDDYIKDDIFRAACLQVGLYTNTLRNLNIEFLKNNFEEFAKNIPMNVVPYYRGVIERGASVYLYEYTIARQEKDLEALEREVNMSEGGNGKNKQLVKSNGIALDMDMNEKINDNIYGGAVNKSNEAAFMYYLVVPTLAVISVIAFSLLALILGN